MPAGVIGAGLARVYPDIGLCQRHVFVNNSCLWSCPVDCYCGHSCQFHYHRTRLVVQTEKRWWGLFCGFVARGLPAAFGACSGCMERYGRLTSAFQSVLTEPSFSAFPVFFHTFTGIHTASFLLTFAGFYSLNVQLATPGGISAAYYDGAWPSTSATMQRTDPTIGATSGGDVGFSPSGFSSVRWSGRISSSISGVHTFYVTSQSGVRGWVDGVLLLDRWSAQCNSTAFTSTLQASALHHIQFDAKIPSDSSPIHVQWASAAFSRQSVSSNQLFYTAHIAGSPFNLQVEPAAACASKSVAALRGGMFSEISRQLRFMVLLFVCCIKLVSVM